MVPIQSELAPKFWALRARIRLAVLFERGATFLLVFGAFLVLSVPLDFFVHLVVFQRLCLLAVFAGAAFWLAVRPLLGAFGVRLTNAGLAAAVERAYPHLEDRLVSAVEFSENPPAPAESESLRAAVVADALSVARELDFGGAVDADRAGKHRKFAFAALAALAALVMFAPGTAFVWAARNLLLLPVEWPRRTDLVVERKAGEIWRAGEVRRVPKGEDFPIVIRAKGQSIPKSVHLYLVFGNREKETRILSRIPGSVARYTTTIPRAYEAFAFRVRGGDHLTDSYQVEIQERPRVRSVAVRYTPPDYLKKPPPAPAPPYPVESAASAITLPVGSVVEVEVSSSKPLAPGGAALRFVQGKTTLDRPAASVSGTEAKFSFELAASARASVRLRDTDGLESASDAEMTFVAKEDEPPRVALKLEGVRPRATPKGGLRIGVHFRDDWALSSASLLLLREPSAVEKEAAPEPAKTGGEAPKEPPKAGEAAGPSPVAPTIRPIPSFRAGVRELKEDRLEIPLSGLGLEPGDNLLIWAEAKDNDTRKGPKSGASEKLRVRILSRDELAAVLLAEQQSLRKAFERTLQDQKDIRKDFDALRPNLSPGARLTDKEAVTARALEQAERKVVRSTGDAGKDFDRILDEQRMNAIGDAGDQTRLQGIVDSLQSISQRTLPPAAEALKMAARNDPATRPEGLGTATTEHLDRGIQAMEQVLARMLKLETIREIVELVRGLRSKQEQIKGKTEEEYKKIIDAFLKPKE